MDINRPNSPNSFLPLYSNNSVNCANSSNNLSTKLQNSIDINSTCNNDEDTDITANNKANIQKLETFNNAVVSINHQNNIDNTIQRNNKSDNNLRNDVEKCYNNQQSAAISNGYLKEAETDYNPEKGESFKIASTSNNENAENDCNVITNALNKDFSNAFIPAYSTNGRLYESEGLSHDNPMYNESVNKTYTDTSRRESVQPVDEEVLHLLNTIQSTDQNNLIQVTDPTKPLLAVCQNANEKHLKSIVKSPSSQSVGISGCTTTTTTRKSRPKPALQCLNPDGHVRELPDSEATTPTVAGEFERPVLHVQFMPNDDGSNPAGQGDSANCNFGSHNRRKSDCRSPIGSISSGSTGTSSSSSDDDNSSIGQYSEARAPDGGWGWVVVFASFIVNLIADGVTFSFGVIFVEFLNYFGKGKAKTAWIGSLFMAIPLLSGPIASFLTDRYGCRKVTIAGSILACIGFVTSSFSNSMEMLFFTFGILAGFGLSLCYVAAVVIVAYYFEKKRSFATGLSVCGSGIGTFIFAPLTQLLLDEYGWRGTTLILAGVFLNMCVCGMLMRDLEWTTHRAKLKAKERKQSKLGVSADSFSVSNSTNTGGTTSILNQPLTSTAENGGSNNNGSNGVKIDEHFDDPRLFSSLITLPTFVRNGERVPLEVLELLSTHRNVHNLLQNYPSLLHSRSFSEPLSSRNAMTSDAPMSPNKQDEPNTSVTSDKANCNTEEYRKEQALLAWIKKNGEHHSRDSRHHPSAAYLKDLRIHRHSLTYRGAMLNINRYRLRASSCPDIYRNSMTTIAKEKTAWYQGIDEFKNLFVDILDISYFADMRFLLFAFSNFLLYTWYDVPYVYLTDNAIEMGIEETDASMLIGIIGIVNMFGEIGLGWIGDVKGISASLVYAVCMALCGAVTAMVPLSNSYTWLCSISGLFGLFIAANYALTSIILVELITLERFTNAYGLLLLVQGVANLVGPPLAGWIYDVTGTYDLSFYVAGFFISISGGLLFILPALGKYRKYRALRRQNLPDKLKTPKAPALNKDSDATNKYNGTTILSDCFNKELLKETVKANHV